MLRFSRRPQGSSLYMELARLLLFLFPWGASHCCCEYQSSSLEVIVDNSSPSDGNKKKNIAPNMVGFSMEIPGVAQNLDDNSHVYLQLLKNLAGRSMPPHPGPIIRLGGDTADYTCYDNSTMIKGHSSPLPGGCRRLVTNQDLLALQRFATKAARHVNVSYIIDTNFGISSDPQFVAVELVKQINSLKLWDWVSGIEIGNEVDLYTGRKRHFRDPSYVFTDYVVEFDRYIKAYREAGMPNPLVHGGTFNRMGYIDHLDQYMDIFESKLKTFSYHLYPIKWDPRIQKHWDVDMYQAQLLGLKGVQCVLNTIQPLIDIVKKHGASFIIGEGNSVNRGGMPGVSDTFVSALWVSDFLPSMSQTGVEQVHFHGSLSPSSVYSAFTYDTKSREIQVRPIYYGMVLFTELVANNSHWLNTNITAIPPHPHFIADPLGEHGIVSSNVCCSIACNGRCGGANCAGLPGGARGCCVNKILSSEFSCDNGTAPCIINPTSPDEVIVAHAAYSTSNQVAKVLLIAKRHDDRTAHHVNVCLSQEVCSSPRLELLSQQKRTSYCQKVGQLVRLTAPSINSTYLDLIQFAGQTFANTTNGRPIGLRNEEQIDSFLNSTTGSTCFHIIVHPLSAILLSVRTNIDSSNYHSIASL